MLRKINKILLPVLSGILLSIPFCNPDLWFISWWGMLPLFVSLEGRKPLKSFFYGWLCGVAFWGVTIYWLVHVTLAGQIALITYLALYFGIFSCALSYFRALPPGRFLFFVPGLWVLLEYARSHLLTGFPWALAGLSQYKNIPVIQISDITGSWGVSFILLLSNAACYLVLRKRLGMKNAVLCACVLFLTLGYGVFNIFSRSGEPARSERSLDISVIQGNIAQEMKWEKKAASAILGTYAGLTAKAAGEGGGELIVWPEASMPFVFAQPGTDYQFARVFDLASDTGRYILIGAVSFQGGRYFNSAILVDKSGEVSGLYNKIHLVPFGEYIPLKDTFPFLRSFAPIGDIEPGREYTVFDRPAPFSVLVCFEDLFPELSREFVKRGAGFLVNITNDAWYKESSAPYQHLAASVFRAVENRIYVVRSANTGVSGFIDALGRVSPLSGGDKGKEIFARGCMSRRIDLKKGGITLYSRYGDFFVLFCLFSVALSVLPCVRKCR
ncbi:MAG: apolipoprotein N-acyltransferase [Candidatus Omnitrophica bacterium]|nr:apolipoprotein N-acyltransferase [Candidatus Omnitrophota bacterium]MDD5042215.1 apolipoprotein N-acyltransferase [Candidatus Omnitrophota bacterium]MDD5500070.1 apolipoprotein N-acyltransferase [Candidatus Omnitrophota bacterium]